MSSETRRKTWWSLSIFVLCVGGCGGEPGAPRAETAPTNLAALEQRIDAAAALTNRLKAVSAVKRLQHAYGHYSEIGLWHDFADLFSGHRRRPLRAG